MASSKSELNVTDKQIVRLYEGRRYREAIKKIEKKLNANINQPSLWQLLCDCYNELGDSKAALGVMLQRVKLFPHDADALCSLAQYQARLGLYGEAEAHYLKATLLSSTPDKVWMALATLYTVQNRLGHAEASYNKVLDLYPTHIDASLALGILYLGVESYKPALALFKNVVESEGDEVMNGQFLNAIGVCYRKLGLLEESIHYLNKAIAINPSDGEYYVNKGNTLIALDRNKESLVCMKEAVRLNCKNPKLFKNLGWSYRTQPMMIDALSNYKRAVELGNGDAEFKVMVQAVYQELGDFKSGEAAFPESEQAQARTERVMYNQISYYPYNPDKSAADILRLYKQYVGLAYPVGSGSVLEKKRESLQGRKIRVGFISPDFKSHVCRYFYEPLLKHNDSSRISLFAYSNSDTEDAVTAELKGYFQKWLDVTGFNDKEAANAINQDEIDILIDLAGHTHGNRLGVLALRPAPMQVSYLGYGYTTGLSQIDYFIGDDHFTPFGCEDSFSEGILRLEGPAFCYVPPTAKLPEITPPPVLRNGFVTFGSLSRLVRFNDRVLVTWSKILEALPSSKLILDQRAFADEKTKEWFYSRMQRLGLPIDRIILRSKENHWESFQDIDISLDSFPHNAGTTIFESLFMGVPVLSKLDRPSVGRFGASILTPLEMTDWLASTEEEYVEKAVSLSSDVQGLVQIRASLRQRMESSPLMDSEGFAKDFQARIIEALQHKEKLFLGGEDAIELTDSHE